uniref:Poly(ADP-ribose) polymerase family member 8 n=1 Tax=Rousettus aegyptiacus TaxID=9407 RepID=A0A7J8F224_ROUAE|nr:poly(ADP-ribose) polymerase family member 8 [Rousettus aegyptiacus]
MQSRPPPPPPPPPPPFSPRITSETTSPSAPASARGIDLMGMCSRQERIQKDIDVVIQKSRAEKDCSFADFRYSDSTFTFTYVGGPKSNKGEGR